MLEYCKEPAITDVRDPGQSILRGPSMIRTEIVDGWRILECPTPSTPSHNVLPPIPATVPGHVHLDLKPAGIIPDPFYRLHERDVTWVDDTDWVYETQFQVDALSTSNIFLKFHGLDTVAEISLND